jgi:hypothetical protein
MAGYIGWHDLHFGTRNAYDGECDIGRNLLIWVGVPVAFVYRGAMHRIALGKVKEAKHRARLRQFLRDYLGDPSEQAVKFQDPLDIPLKRRPALGWMAGLQLLVWLAGVATLLGVIATVVLLSHGGRLGMQGHLLLAGAAAAPVAFAGLLALYLRLHRPSRRQAGIRAAVLRQVGTYADLADWKVESLGPLFPVLGVVSLEPTDVLAEAEALRGAGKLDDALVRARITLAFAHPREESFLIERAELLTDECLLRLEAGEK